MTIWAAVEKELSDKNLEKAIKLVKDFVLVNSTAGAEVVNELFLNDISEINLATQDLLNLNPTCNKVLVRVRNFTDLLTPWAFKLSVVKNLNEEISDEFEFENNQEYLGSSEVDLEKEFVMKLEGMWKTQKAISAYFSEYALDTNNLVAKHEYEALSLLTYLKFAKLIKKSLKNEKVSRHIKVLIVEEDNDYLKISL